MTNTVYDTSVVVLANGDLGGRKKGNALDRRLGAIEEFLTGRRTAWYNGRLEVEYREKLKSRRNDVIEAFFRHLVDAGRRAGASSLSRQDYAKAKNLGWPSHDQHLLAAAIAGTEATLFVTEELLAKCYKKVRRQFGVTVCRL